MALVATPAMVQSTTSVAESSELSDAGAVDTACTVPADNPLYQTAKGFCAGYMIRGDNVMEGAAVGTASGAAEGPGQPVLTRVVTPCGVRCRPSP
jgi:hypothetical protein